MIYVYFVIIGAMRFLQSYCGKRSSLLAAGKMQYLRYNAYRQLISALFGLALACFLGFHGMDGATMLLAAATGLLLTLDMFASLEALKGCTLMLSSMFSTAGLVVPCIVGIFLFDEPMSLFQWLGLGSFLVSAYLLIGGSKQVYHKFSWKTLLLLVVSLLANGAVMVVQKLFALRVPDGNVTLFSLLSFATGAVLLYLMIGLMSVKKENRTGALPKKLLLYGLALAAAVFVVNQLVTLCAAVVPSVILFPVSAALSMTITCVVGAAVFHEKLTLKNIFGIVLGFGAILMINLL